METLPPESEQRGSSGSGERILTLVAVLVAASALLVSAYQTYRESQYQKLSVWPRLMVYNNNGGGRYRLIAQNAGLGPATIEGFNLIYQDRSYHDWFEYVAALVGSHASGGFTYNDLVFSGGMVMLPGTESTLLEIAADETAQQFWRAMQQSTVDIRYCYCSVYRECWQDHYGASQPQPVASCD